MSTPGMSRAEGPMSPHDPHLTLIAEGTSGELELPTTELGIPLPGIIELAPEIPVAPHIAPRHNPDEIGAWFTAKAIAQRAADRRLLRTREEAKQSKHLRPAEKETSPQFEVVLDEERIRDLSEEERLKAIEKARLEQLRTLPFAKGMRVQSTPEERAVADQVLRNHHRSAPGRNIRFA